MGGGLDEVGLDGWVELRGGATCYRHPTCSCELSSA